MATEQRLIDADFLLAEMDDVMNPVNFNLEKHYSVGRWNGLVEARNIVLRAPTVDAVEVPDKELLRAIKLLIKQYEHSKNSEYVHSPVAHALFHTWRQVDERRTDHV